MSRCDECIPSPDSPASQKTPASQEDTPASLDPDVCVFRHVALLHVPQPCRAPLRHLGNLLFDWSMETFGIADEEPDTEAITARRMEAIAEDLKTAGDQLAALGLEHEGFEIGRVELALCDAAGKLAPPVLDLSAKLRKAAERALS